jgi:hypothetical protein
VHKRRAGITDYYTDTPTAECHATGCLCVPAVLCHARLFSAALINSVLPFSIVLPARFHSASTTSEIPTQTHTAQQALQTTMHTQRGTRQSQSNNVKQTGKTRSNLKAQVIRGHSARSRSHQCKVRMSCLPTGGFSCLTCLSLLMCQNTIWCDQNVCVVQRDCCKQYDACDFLEIIRFVYDLSDFQSVLCDEGGVVRVEIANSLLTRAHAVSVRLAGSPVSSQSRKMKILKPGKVVIVLKVRRLPSRASAHARSLTHFVLRSPAALNAGTHKWCTRSSSILGQTRWQEGSGCSCTGQGHEDAQLLARCDRRCGKSAVACEERHEPEENREAVACVPVLAGRQLSAHDADTVTKN